MTETSMTPSADSAPFAIPTPIARKIDRLQWLIRLYALLESIALLILLLGMAFWIAFAIDWFLEPSPRIRLVMWGLVMGATLWLMIKFLFRRIFAHLPRSAIALILERQFPQLQESLVTTVEAAQRSRVSPLSDSIVEHKKVVSQQDRSQEIQTSGSTSMPSSASFRPVMLNRTSRIAAEQLVPLRLMQVFRIRPLIWKLLTALGMVVSLAGFATAYQEQFDFWLQRMKLANTPWPRQVHLEVLGFVPQEDGQRIEKVARDDAYVLQVRASILDGHVVPNTVEIRYRLADGRRGRDTMTRVGESLPGRDEFQRYRYEFKHVISDLHFEVFGGDDRVDGLQLQVVERPQIVGLSVDIDYPAYLQRESDLIDVNQRLELPVGASASFRVQVSKPLRSVQVRTPGNSASSPEQAASENREPTSSKRGDSTFPQNEPSNPIQAARNDLAISEAAEIEVEMIASDPDNPAEVPGGFRFHLDSVRNDRILLFTMLDADGIVNRIPYRLLIAVIHDEVPEVTTRMLGIGTAITPQAVLPFTGKITDEYGIEKIWFEYRIDEQEKSQKEIRFDYPGSREFQKLESFDLAETDPSTHMPRLELKPGQKLAIAVRAQDSYDLIDEPHVGTGQKFLLEIVTPSELRAILEKRELGLRQRFEAIYEKLIASRDFLDRTESYGNSEIPDGVPEPDANDDTPANRSTPSNDPRSQPANTKRIRETNRMRIMSVLQNVSQLAYETLGVADGFETIVAELINNRVDTRDLTHRLQTQIAHPLFQIGQEQLPALEKQLQVLQDSFEEPGFPSANLRTTRQQTDSVIIAMKSVLDRMLELESYNELVETLRSILADQKRLSEETKEKQRTRLRSLLEDL